MTIPDEAVEAAARAIWVARGGIPRLFYKTARPNSHLAEQVEACWHAARAALTAAAPMMVGWRDISSAPRDETRFWGKVGDDAIAMSWHPTFEAFVSSWSWMTMAPGYTINGKEFEDHSPRVHEPEGWMPMPPQPDTQRTGLAEVTNG